MSGAAPPGCRFCSRPLEHVFVDLGTTPLANSFVDPEGAAEAEPRYPLRAYVCDGCLLVQLPEHSSREEIFGGDYAYFTSVAETAREHAEAYVREMVERFGFDGGSRVIEVASNDGYLLRYFRDRGIPVLGIEPAPNVARAAVEAGIPTRVEFFGVASARALAAAGERADLLLGNNVLAHVPDLNDFVAGLAIALAPGGVLTVEFPHLTRLVEGNQFDTIYHEHFSYFSFATARRVFAEHGLEVFDVAELPTHGGSLRVFARHAGERTPPVGPAVAELAGREERAGYGELAVYRSFQERVRETKRKLLDFLRAAKAEGRAIAAYGAPAKGNTLLNYCGVGRDVIDYTVDLSPHKQGRLLPGTRIPIEPPARIAETRPDLLFILPWNLRDEIARQMAGIREWGGRFFVAIPEVEVWG